MHIGHSRWNIGGAHSAPKQNLAMLKLGAKIEIKKLKVVKSKRLWHFKLKR